MTDFSIIKKLYHIVEPSGFTNDEIENHFLQMDKVLSKLGTEF